MILQALIIYNELLYVLTWQHQFSTTRATDHLQIISNGLPGQAGCQVCVYLWLGPNCCCCCCWWWWWWLVVGCLVAWLLGWFVRSLVRLFVCSFVCLFCCCCCCRCRRRRCCYCSCCCFRMKINSWISYFFSTPCQSD